MEVCDTVMDAIDVVMNWDIPERALGAVVWMQARAMAGVAPEESAQSLEGCSCNSRHVEISQ